MQNTSGFYKLDGGLLYAPNFVLNKNYELHRGQYTTYSYPVDSWYWFGTDDEAYTFFGLEKPVVDNTDSTYLGLI